MAVQEAFPNPEASDILQLANKIGLQILKDKEYVRLKVEDLKRHGIVKPNQDLGHYMMEKLGLNDSSVKEALFALEEQIPPPNDTAVVYRAQGDYRLSREEELAIRREYLEGNENLIEALARASGKEALAEKILQSAGVLEEDGDRSFDPAKIKENFELYERLINQYPTILEVNGNQCFALRIPRDIEDSPGAIIAGFMLPPSIGEYIVVVDPDKNSALSSFLYGNQNLFKYYYAKRLVEIQARKKREAEQEISSVASDKYKETEEKEEQINRPLQIKAFELLQKDAKERGKITLMNTFRDNYDVAAIRGVGPVKTDRTGSESSARTYHLSVDTDDNLVIEWEGREGVMEWQEDEGKKTMALVFKPTQAQAFIRKNPENETELEFGVKSEDGKINWDAKGPTEEARRIFKYIKAVTISQLLEEETISEQEGKLIIDDLLKAKSSPEFFQKSIDYNISGFPSRETLVVLNPKFHYVYDFFPPPPQEQVSKN